MNYLKIDKEDMCNGEGLRVVLWLSGCSHKCKGCQNPQTWDANSGIPFDESAKEELFRELDKDYISGLTLTGGDPLFEENLDGVLDLVTEINKRYNTRQDMVHAEDENHNILNENANRIRLSSPHKSIWLYTGYIWEQLFDGHICASNERSGTKRRDIVKQCDVLIDGRYIDAKRDITLSYRGSSNQRIICIRESLKLGKIVTLSK